MILQALCEHYQRMLARGESGLSGFGFSTENISYEIILRPDGEVVEVRSLLQAQGKKLLPQSLTVPKPPKRSSGIRSCFCWDKTSYVLGVSASSKRAAAEHAAFCHLHQQLLAGVDDDGLQALLHFLERWDAAQFVEPHFKPEMLDTNVVFRLDGQNQRIHESPVAQRLIAAQAAGADADADTADDPDSGQGAWSECLVSGAKAAVADTHPSIKGVDGAQSSGASLVSFNQPAFESFGKVQGANAPISITSAFEYTTALNHLLRRGPHNRQRLTVGDATVVFWAATDDAATAPAAEDMLAMMLNPTPPSDDTQETELVLHSLEAVAKGRALRDINPKLDPATRMYVLGLSPNAARLSVRYWFTDSLGELTRRLGQHARDLALEPQPWKTPPGVWRLALSTAPSRIGPTGQRSGKAEDVAPQLAGDLMRAILTGAPYPRSLLTNIVMRMRSDGDISGLRAAICKAVIQRRSRLAGHSETTLEVPVSLDESSVQPGYLLGRLFAVLEGIQRTALGANVNATIRDRYYGAASATPGLVFPMLLRNAQNHLARVRKDRPGLYVNWERQMRQILDGLPAFPRHLRLQDQGLFAIGYYHQESRRFAGSAAAADASASMDESAVAESASTNE